MWLPLPIYNNALLSQNLRRKSSIFNFKLQNFNKWKAGSAYSYILNIRVDHSRFLFRCLTICSETNLSIPQLCVCVCMLWVQKGRCECVCLHDLSVCIYMCVLWFLWLLSYMKCTSNALFTILPRSLLTHTMWH